MKRFIRPIVKEINNIFAAKTNTCTSVGSGNNNNCSSSGMG